MQKPKQFRPVQTNQSSKKFNGRAGIEAMYKTAEWEKYSRNYLSINTRCYTCGDKSQAVDHLKAHKGDEILFWKLDNMIPLCHRCHNYCTAVFDKFVVQKFNEKLNWLSRIREKNSLDFRVKVVPR